MKSKVWWKSKMVWFNIAVAFAAMLDTLAGSALLKNEPELVSGIGVAIGIGNIILRSITTDTITLRND